MSDPIRPAGISGLSEIAGGYISILCDIWGVVHDGLRAHRDAVDALMRFRGNGGRVILITNAPRPNSIIIGQLDRLGVDRAAYDEVVTSGDVAGEFLAGWPEAKIFHLGPERDLPIYEGLPNRLVEEATADLVSCTGLFDDTRETPDDYMEMLARLAGRGLPMLCVNPDKVVGRGGKLIWCAGALAARYAGLGGETIIFGKPHAPIYDVALDHFHRMLGRPVAKSEVLAIGDGVETDVRGACEQGIDVLFVTHGIHAAEFGLDVPDANAVHSLLTATGLGAKNFTARLAW